jgi:hypothetical protein
MTRRDRFPRRPPSVGAGLAMAWRLRGLVGVLWIVHHLLLAPLWGVAVTTFGGSSAARLAPGSPDGEFVVVVLELARPVVWPLALAAASAVAGGWVWAVLWRAGVVTWAVWGTSGRPRITEILGHGVVRWWRFARLHAVVTAALGAMVVGIAIVVGHRFEAAARVAADPRVVEWSAGAFIAWIVLSIVAGTVIAAGCWRLGTPGVHSALHAAAQGAVVIGRHPVRAPLVTAAWWVAAGLLTAGPVWMAVSGASQAATVVVLEVCLVARAACRVGLLGSFLPLLGVESEVAGSR